MFYPEEILFSPTTSCNLSCIHCDIEKSKNILSKSSAMKFLRECKGRGIKRLGFTGGEPFLALGFLCAISKKAVEEGLLFDRIMTNGVWFRKKRQLEDSLKRLNKAGYDGSICVSVDYFHRQDLKKVAAFINMASSIWNRKDAVSIAYVRGAKDAETELKIRRLSRLLKARLIGFSGSRPRIKNDSLFIKIFKIDLSPIGNAFHLKNPWDGKWLKEDYCKGPGNALYVMPDGSVKPCCGYANDADELTIGNIGHDSVKEILKNKKTNRFVSTVFNSGLSAIRKKLESSGYRFPGKTQNHCYFCHYLLNDVPRGLLDKCLD